MHKISEKKHIFILLVALVTGIAARAQVTASFSAAPTSGCVPLTVNFTDNSINANQYFWDFGNGNTSTLQNPTTIYLSPGMFTVTLVVTNTLTGQRDTMVAQNYIHTIPAPVTSFIANTLSGCENDNVISFTNTSTGAISYIWDFGDGNSSSQINPVHTYLNAGTYTVKLISTNGFGCNTIQTRLNYITIYPEPSFSLSASFTSSCDSNDVFQFSASGTGISSWYWDFGDGSSSVQQNPSHSYGTTGNFTVTLIGTNGAGCSDTIVKTNYINIGNTLVPNFSATQLTGCDSLTTTFHALVQNATSWIWNFGDGSPVSNVKHPTHTYNAPGSYTITLTVTTSNGCNGTATYTNAIVVDPTPVAAFNITQPDSCAMLTFQFNNTSTNAVNYQWNFGDGNTSTSPNPSHTYSGAGTYNVTLTAYSPNGCSASASVSKVISLSGRIVNFNASPRAGCAPLSVMFSPYNYTGAVAWFWDFGDGNTSTQQYPTNIYTVNGFYTVKLVITTSNGCVDSIIKVNHIRILPGHVNYSLPDTITGCVPYGISFTTPLQGCDTIIWTFGNGDSAFTPNTSYTYTTPGIYVVSFYGSMPNRCRQLINPFAIIQVSEFIPDSIIILSSSGCQPFQFHFDNLTPNVVSYTWNFGDNTPPDTTKDPVHVFAQAGTYTVSVTLTDINGCVSTVSTTVTVGRQNPIQISNFNNCANNPIQFNINNPAVFTSWTWNFGDGSPVSNLLNPIHSYSVPGSYVISLITTDINGCVDTFRTSPKAIYDIVAGFTAVAPLTGCDSLTVQFNNTSTGATDYLWDFGDGQSSTDPNPVHTYNVAGTYSVTLTASGGSCSKTVTQNNIIIVRQAQADFSYSSNGTCYPVTVVFTDLSTNAVSWYWNFGDGYSSTLQNPTHVFHYPPSGPITLTITDNNGCTKTISKPNITGVNISVTVSDTIGCSPFSTSFSGSAQGALSWLWDFGDGNTSTLQNPVHTYTSVGVYNVTLTVSMNNCTATILLPEKIYVIKPMPDFNSPTVAVCAPSLVQFNDLSTGAVQWHWDFGDGTSATVQNPSHIYNIPGYYTVSLTIWDSLGCSATKINTDYIYVPGTYTYFSLIANNNCLNTFVQFSDSSVGATSWLWNFGDGYISTLQNPTHTYLDTGSYTVSLISTDSIGCTSYYTYPDPIVVHPSPVAQGQLITPASKCVPLTVSLINQSTLYTSVVWHFGNGDSSIATNPVYTYQNPGTFNVYLIAYNQFGCQDTFQVAVIDAEKVPDAGFTATPASGCSPLSVQLTNTSNSLQNPSYSWTFGNGQSSTVASPSTVYPLAGNYTITLVVTNDNGCSDTVSSSVTSLLSPTAAANVSDTVGCRPLGVSFTNSSVNATSYIWYFGDGNSSTDFEPVHVYSQVGIFQPYMIATSQNGCSDTISISPVNVNVTPVASFIASTTEICPSSSVTFNSTSSSISNPTYQWNVGGITSGLSSPTITLTQPGFHSVSLTVTNDNGCSDTHTETNYIEVFDNVPPPVTEILSVSVLNNTSVEIKWLPSAAFDLYEYRLYRLNPATNSYNLIYSLIDTNNANPNVNLVYVDNGLNTLHNVYTYKVQTVDRCSYSLPLSQSKAHTTIDVTAQPAGQNIKVSWTPYGGCPVSVYEIRRVELPNGSSVFLGTVPGNGPLIFIDTTLSCPYQYSYRITARDLCGNVYKSLSDTSAASPINTLAGQKVEVIRSTVIFNKNVLTEWTAPNIAPDRVKQYSILRSTDNFNFTPVATVPAGTYNFVDENVDVNKYHYYYKIDVVNDCSLTGTQSNEGSSILLKSNWEKEKTRLNWSEYEEWDSGVEYYRIEKRDPSGQWIQIKIVNGQETETILDE